MRRAPSESAATPDTATSTGRPASSAADRVGAVSGSTETTRLVSPNQPRNPPIRPPPPTATNSVVKSGAWASNSRAAVPWPRTVSGWS